jgi:hypothetical protein
MNEPTLDDIKQVARNENRNNIYIAIEMLCEYIKRLEINSVKPTIGEPRKETSKKKGLSNG